MGRIILYLFAAQLLPSLALAGADAYRASAGQSRSPHSHGRLESVQSWSSEEYTRVVIYLSGPVHYTSSDVRGTGASPESARIRVDLADCTVGSRIHPHSNVNDVFLKAVSVKQSAPDLAQVVLDVRSVRAYRVFSMADPFRVVIDVQGNPPVQEQARVPAPPPPVSGCSMPSLAQQLGLGIRRIVLDPGHGGKDTGATGSGGCIEKDINLAIAGKLKKLIEKRTGCEVILTRSGDRFIPLEERTAIAGTRKADLFISIHANAGNESSPCGIETYYLGFAADRGSAKVAARENATSEKAIHDLAPVLKELLSDTKASESSNLAHAVQEHVLHRLRQCRLGTDDRGVKRAPFYVLLGTGIPSILIETGFVSNQREALLLKESSYQDELAEGITEGVASYIASLGKAVVMPK